MACMGTHVHEIGQHPHTAPTHDTTRGQAGGEAEVTGGRDTGGSASEVAESEGPETGGKVTGGKKV